MAEYYYVHLALSVSSNYGTVYQGHFSVIKAIFKSTICKLGASIKIENSNNYKVVRMQKDEQMEF